MNIRNRSQHLAALLVGLTIALSAGVAAAQDRAPVNPERLIDVLDGALPKSIDELRAMEQRTQQIAKKVMPAVVGIRVGQAAGSGVIVNEEGLVLTAGHVVGKPGQKVTFILTDGSEVRGVTLGANFGIDSGMMKIEGDEGKKWPFVEMGQSNDLESGQWVMAMGHPGGFEADRTPPIRVGRIITKNPRYIVTDCPLIGGDSGGPLFDFDGKVIGINSRIGGAIHTNIHVPIDSYINTWDQLLAGEAWGGNRGPGSPFIGVAADPDSQEAAIREVVPDSPAAKAGIQAGDVITKFDGRPIDTFQDLVERVGGKKPRDKVTIELRRDGNLVELELTIGRYGN